MKKTLAIIVSIIFVLSFAGLSFAADKAVEKKAEPVKAEKKAPAMAEKKAPAKVKQVTGDVAAVDANAKTITVKGKKGDVVIAADDKMMAGIMAGDKVVVKYTEADGKNTAKSVKKAAAKAEKKAVKAEKMEKKAEPAKTEKK
jgi:hypothetical protein